LMNATQFQTATGRSLRPGVTTETVNLLLPGQIYGERVNNVDMRCAKIIHVRRTRANIGIDLYNLMNSNTGTAFEATYDPATNGLRLLRPTTVGQAPVVAFHLEVHFLGT